MIRSITERSKKNLHIDLDVILEKHCASVSKFKIPKINQKVKSSLKKISEKYNINIITTRNRLLILNWLKKNKIDKYINSVVSY